MYNSGCKHYYICKRALVGESSLVELQGLNHAVVAQGLSHHLAKTEIMGSNPISHLKIHTAISEDQDYLSQNN